MRNDMHSNVGVVFAIPPAEYDADNVPAAIDLHGFDAALILIEVGVGGITFTGTHKVEFKLTHANAQADGSAPDAGDYSAVTAEHVLGPASVGEGGIVRALVAAHAEPSVTKVGYRGGRRYLKLLADFSGTHGEPTPMSAVVVKGLPRLAPVA